MKTAIISGGNGGLGRAMAQLLEARGWHCVLMDINTTGLEASPSRTPVSVDLTDAKALHIAAEQIIASRPSIDLVIYNAGVSQIGPFADTDAASHRRVFEINYFAAVEMTRAFLPAIRKSRGTHLAISSVAGFAPLHGRTAYAASKHAMQGFFTSLRSEEAPYGVHCLIAAPSFVATNIANPDQTEDGIQRPGSASDGVDYMTPESAAHIILQGLEKKRDFTPVGRIAQISSLLMRASPKLYQRAMRKKINGNSVKE
jgi:short-subunit dehydrogenase